MCRELRRVVLLPGRVRYNVLELRGEQKLLLALSTTIRLGIVSAVGLATSSESCEMSGYLT